MKLRKPYAKQDELANFVPDLRAASTGNDLQIVASTVASGLQTRIVESLAQGLPVLASETAAQGLEHLRSGQDIIIVRAAGEFADAIRALADNRNRIDQLSMAGRRFYERHHSRHHVAGRLRNYLSRMPVM